MNKISIHRACVQRRFIKALLMTKLVLCLIIASLLHVSARTMAQKITLSVKQADLKTLFTAIRQQSGYHFVFTQDMLKNTFSVSIEVKDADIETVLEKVFENQPLVYTLEEKTVIVKEKGVMETVKDFFGTGGRTTDEEREVPSQDGITITGRVTDSLYQPIAGATVRVKNGKGTASTDADGTFKLKHVSPGATLRITAMGYQPKEIVASENMGNIILSISESKLDEVQIIAYGTTTQRYSTGSVTKVTSKEIENQPITNVFQALEGRVPGLVVSQTSGLTGASMKIQIRGQNSLNPNKNFSGTNFDSPLIIIDGVPFGPQNLNVNQMSSALVPMVSSSPGANGIGALNSLNPSEIESIEVLRDADATAIYGSRGANGIILITTKRGKAGPTAVSASVWSGQSQATRTIEMMNTQEYLAMRNQAMKNDGLTPSSDPSNPGYAPDLTLFDQNKYNDWQKYLLGNTAHTTDANVQISGGAANTQFLVGTGYHH